MQRRIMTFAAGVSCLINASLLPADSFEPAFVAYKPRVLVTPDNLPLMRWDQPGVATAIDPSELAQLEPCTPGVCPQEALDAGAAYYKVFGDVIAYYDQYGRLVGTTNQSTSYRNAGISSTTLAAAADPTVTPAGVPYADILVGATPGAFEVTSAGAATYKSRFLLATKRIPLIRTGRHRPIYAHVAASIECATRTRQDE